MTSPRHFLRKILILLVLGVDRKRKILIPEDLSGKYLESVGCEGKQGKGKAIGFELPAQAASSTPI